MIKVNKLTQLQDIARLFHEFAFISKACGLQFSMWLSSRSIFKHIDGNCMKDPSAKEIKNIGKQLRRLRDGGWIEKINKKNEWRATKLLLNLRDIMFIEHPRNLD